MKRLDGKVAIVTGATGGIGEATAKLFLSEGARVMLVGRSAEKLKETRGRLNAGGADVNGLSARYDAPFFGPRRPEAPGLACAYAGEQRAEMEFRPVLLGPILPRDGIP